MARQEDIECDRVVERVDARPIEQERVVDIAASVERLGLINRIVVRPRTIARPGYRGPGYEVIAGRHRLRAFIRLGRETVPAVIIEADDVAAELVMIAENLHRSDLTALQRDQQVARWVELTGDKPRQTDEVSGGRGNKGGVANASRNIGVSEPDARRAIKVASLSPDAKAAAVEVGLDDNRAALLEAASKHPDEQAAYLRERMPKPKPTAKQLWWRAWAEMTSDEQDEEFARLSAMRPAGA